MEINKEELRQELLEKYKKWIEKEKEKIERERKYLKTNREDFEKRQEQEEKELIEQGLMNKDARESLYEAYDLFSLRQSEEYWKIEEYERQLEEYKIIYNALEQYRGQ